MRPHKQRDPIGQKPRVPARPIVEVHSFIQPEQGDTAGILRWRRPILHDDLQVVDGVGDPRREISERLIDQQFELIAPHGDGGYGVTIADELCIDGSQLQGA